jgi:NitT/TauT family transport system substrate-binding protein
MSAGMFNAIGRGVEVQIVASHGQYARDADAPAGFYVRSELIESGEVTEIADLRGRNLGLAGGLADIGNAGGYLISLMLAEGGLTLKDMNIVNVAVTDSPTAFASGSIDATFLPGQVAPIVVEDDTARPFGDPNVLAEKVQGGTLLGPDLLEERPEVARAVLRALFRAAAELQGDYRGNEQVVEALVATGEFERERIVNFPYYYFDPELIADEAAVTEFQEIFIELGGVIESGEVLPYEELVAEDLRAEAYDSYVACYG